MLLVTLLLGIAAALSSAAVLTRGVWLLLSPTVSATSVVLALAVYYIAGGVFLWLMLRVCGFGR